MTDQSEDATTTPTNGVLYCEDRAFWQLGQLANHERFDLIPGENESLILRACPYNEEQWRSAGRRLHVDDESFVEGSHCGFTKWTCVGCGQCALLADEDAFPGGWIEISTKDDSGDTTAYEAVCSTACLGRFAERGITLRPVRIPGFGPLPEPLGAPAYVASSDVEYTVRAEPGMISMIIVESGGTTTTTDLTSYAQLLMRLGASEPLDTEESSSRTVTFGDLSCDDSVTFWRGENEMSLADGMALLDAGLYRCIQQGLRRVEAPHNAPSDPAPATDGVPLAS